MTSIDNEASFRAELGEGVNLMLGSGFSVLAHDTQRRPLPVGAALAQELRDLFKVDQQRNLGLPQIYSIIAAKDREAADAFLKQRFTVTKFDPRYRVLEQLSIKTIFTTNIDNLPQRIYENSIEHYLNDLALRGPVYKDKAAIDLLNLHGSVLDDSRPYRFTTLDVASSFSADPTAWQVFRQRLSAAPTLFWGYSLSDPAALEALQRNDAVTGTRGNNWIVLRPKEKEEHKPLIEYFRALQFQLIFAETADLLDYFQTVTQISRPSTPENISSRVEQYRVPTPGSFPLRPLQDFYAGAAPAWSDVYRDEVHRVRQYKDAHNRLSRGRHVIITGIPASGKTTTLMQLAASNAGHGIALMPESLTETSASRLGRLLNGASATVFVDNVCDDIDVFNKLCSIPNVLVAAADRDYNLSTVMHRLGTSNVDFVSMSEIDEYDLGAVRARIPGGIRTPMMQHPDTTRGHPSLLEFNIANTTSRSLARRLEDALYKYQHEQPQLGEMLLLVAYVYYCRTPVSLDMAIAYWRDTINDWQDVYVMVEQVGRLLSEYEGDLREDGQDYFAARSAVVAEAAVNAASGASLKRILTRFHYNVAATRICRYDIFRRRGYSAHLFDRAFRNVDEAVDFYNYLFSRDESPYLLQQKALFLSRRRRYADSFAEIDRAVAMTKEKNWTIQATHAELLMRANLDLAATDPGARTQVNKGMGLLKRCYMSDRRRSLHALKFADYALEYDSLFGDEQSHEYLRQAREWLERASRDEPWLTRPGPLLRQVARRLG